MPSVRRLAAILAADVSGYSRLMGADEEGTHERLKAHLGELVNPKIAEHRGRTVKNTGDGFLAEFSSVVDAVRCAAEIQRGMINREPEVPEERRIRLRIGINLGDVIAEEDDIFGDGVNIAARLEALAEPGGVLVSNTVHDHVRDRLPFVFEDLGEQQVKNIARPVRIYRVRDVSGGVKSPSATTSPVLRLHDKPSIAVLPFANMSGDPEQEYFSRWHGRGDHYRAVAHPLAVRHRPQFELHVQRPGRRREAGRARSWRALCARRLGAQGRQPG
jgi:adenylate cyclase